MLIISAGLFARACARMTAHSARVTVHCARVTAHRARIQYFMICQCLANIRLVTIGASADDDPSAGPMKGPEAGQRPTNEKNDRPAPRTHSNTLFLLTRIPMKMQRRRWAGRRVGATPGTENDKLIFYVPLKIFPFRREAIYL